MQTERTKRCLYCLAARLTVYSRSHTQWRKSSVFGVIVCVYVNESEWERLCVGMSECLCMCVSIYKCMHVHLHVCQRTTQFLCLCLHESESVCVCEEEGGTHESTCSWLPKWVTSSVMCRLPVGMSARLSRGSRWITPAWTASTPALIWHTHTTRTVWRLQMGCFSLVPDPNIQKSTQFGHSISTH